MDASTPDNPPAQDRVHALYKRLLALLVPLAGVGYVVDLMRRTATTAIIILANEDPVSVTRRAYYFKNSATSPTYESIGITYHGYAGAGWAIAQFVIIGAMFAMMMLSRGLVRTIASCALLAMGSIWFLNSAFFMIIADAELFAAITAYHAIGFACMTALAVSRCRSRARSTS